MSILVLNAGSSTLKFALFHDAEHDELVSGAVIWCDTSSSAELVVRSVTSGERKSTHRFQGIPDAVDRILGSLTDNGFSEAVHLVGHRFVHGGTEFRRPTLIDKMALLSLRRLANMAPLHNPPALAGIESVGAALPEVQQVAVFDTAFFVDLPPHATVYPVPYEWYEQHGIRRFGFHGISHAYCSARAAELMGREDDASLRLVICHLGAGCSATAVRGGRPVATTMGFTPLDGLMMGTRCGSIDPGILIHMLRDGRLDVDQLEESLTRRSGLFGVSGVSSDLRDVERAAEAGDERARLAFDMFTDRVASTIGSLAVSLGGVDGLVFTAGIGEHSASARSQVCKGLRCLGLQIDETKNRSGRADSDISECGSPARILVVRTREEQMIAREACRLIATPG